MEGPYRDLGSGFARLTGLEGARRGPSRITHVEDALMELARNARDAGARGIYVASTLKGKRYRTLAVIDDGHGIPDAYRDLILEPGVTTRHLDPVTDPENPIATPHGAGLSLYQIRSKSLATSVLSASDPTAIQTTFDTQSLPERALQSETRPSKTNLRATLKTFAQTTNVYFGPPARILATLLHNRIIQRERDGASMREVATGLGLELSVRSVQRVLRGEVEVLAPITGADGEERGRVSRRVGEGGGPVFRLGEEESAGIADILMRAARAEYLEVEDLRFESRPGEMSITARVYEPEDEYE